MSEMVERVAAAIRESRPLDCYAAYEQAARAAIEAMREPTEAMVGEGKAAPTYGDGVSDIPKVWRAMIDAALVDKI